MGGVEVKWRAFPAPALWGLHGALMFKFLRESKYDAYDDETMEGLKNFLFLVGMLGFFGVFLATIAYWLGHH